MKIQLASFLVSALFSIYLGFFAFDGSQSVRLVTHYGHWVISLTFFGYAYLLGCAVHEKLSLGDRSTAWKYNLALLPDALLFIIIWLLLLVHETHGFKIIMDEINLLGTSMSMHFDRQILTPSRGYNLDGTFLITNGFLDKRPYFFPFLVSLVHDIFGYAPENAFYLNNGLLFVFLMQIYRFGYLVSGVWGGRICLISTGGIPLVSQVSNGAGFELLNVIMILAVLLHGITFLKDSTNRSLTLLLLACVLLAQVRYESIIFIFPVTLIIIMDWVQMKRVKISLPLIVVPLLFVPYPLLHSVFEQNDSHWQLAGKGDNYTTPFSLEYYGENVADALIFFTSISDSQPNSILVFLVGFTALILFSISTLRKYFNRSEFSNEEKALTCILLGLGSLFILLMLYFWGDFLDPVVRRLSLPIFLMFILPIPFLVQWLEKYKVSSIVLFILFSISLYSDALPKMSKNIITSEYLPARHLEWRREFIKAQPDRNYLMIDAPGIWVTHQIASVPHTVAKKKKDQLNFHLSHRTFREIFVFQRFSKDFKDRELIPVSGTFLDESFVLETVAERSYDGISHVRISRIVEINNTSELEIPYDLEIEELIEMSKPQTRQLEGKLLQFWAENLP